VSENIASGFFAALVEPIHIELSNERVNIAVSEVPGKDLILEKFDRADSELPATGQPVYHMLMLLSLQDLEGLVDEGGHQPLLATHLDLLSINYIGWSQHGFTPSHPYCPFALMSNRGDVVSGVNPHQFSTNPPVLNIS
jgi:hypothetical protein